MDWFDDSDPFEDIINNFFGERASPSRRSRSRNIIRGEEEDRIIDFVESDSKIYLIFELPGYNEHDMIVSADKNELQIQASKKECDVEKVQDYLTRKLCKGINLRKDLPSIINVKSMKHTMRNGILEVSFDKK